MEIESVIMQIYEQAKHIGACHLFTGEEKSLDDLVSLFLSPQGIEFCTKKHFPNLSTFRLFKQQAVDKKYGIYIDSGEISLQNPSIAVLVGKTMATIDVDECARHRIVLLHGAKAVVNASKWAVASITSSVGCNVIRNRTDNAIIL